MAMRRQHRRQGGHSSRLVRPLLLLLALAGTFLIVSAADATAPDDGGAIVQQQQQQQQQAAAAASSLPRPQRLAQEAGNSTGDDPSPPPPPPPSPPQCKLLGGAFADLVQLSLAAFGLAGLLVKRAKETPCRPWRIWSMDVGKQALGSLYAHFVNMLLAMGLSTLAGGGLDECAWYAVNYLTDSTLGIILCLVIVKLLECWAGWQPAGSWPRLYISQSGNYGSPPQCKIWYWQTLIWIGVVTVSKFGLFFFLLAASDRFGSWGHFLFSPLKDHPQVELVIVMVLMPGCLNVVQFWILDNVLKSNAAETPTAPLSPSKGAFKVSYEPIDDRSGGATRNGRRRNGSTGGGFSWFDPSQPGTEVATSNTQQHSWLRPMNWHWGSQGQGGPGRSGAAATAGATAATPYRPPQPGGGQQLLGAQGAAVLDSQLPPWMTSTYGRPYDDEDGGGGSGAIA